MKRYVGILLVALCILLTACEPTGEMGSMEDMQSDGAETITKSSAVTETETAPPLNSMDRLGEVEDVISVTELDFTTNVKDAVVYRLLYRSNDTQLAAEVVLPSDYTDEDKQYPVLIYFPQVGTYIESLAVNYAQNNVIVVRPYARGYGDSEGTRDLGGAGDLADAQKLLQILDSLSFVSRAKIFVAGSSEGSVTAMRLMAEDTAHRISGCAVVDAMTDLHSYGVARGEAVQNLMSSLIGQTYEAAPEAYELRSAVTFSEKLDRPVLLLHYTQNPLSPVEQTDRLYELLTDQNSDCAYYKIDLLNADFSQEGLQRLLSWINQYD